MAIKSTRTIYQLLEKHLRSAEQPVTCVALMDISEVRKEALAEYGPDVRNATNKLSDALGFMWRRGLLTRFPAPQKSLSFARFSYIWENKDDNNVTHLKPIAPRVRHIGRDKIEIIEHEDGIELSLDNCEIFIRFKIKKK